MIHNSKMSDLFKNSYLSAKDRDIAQHYDNYTAIMKLRKSGTTKLKKVASGVFRRILEYCEPKITTRVVRYPYTNGPCRPGRYTWPEQVSYYNPINGFKYRSDY